MNLGDLITALEAEDPARLVPLGFSAPHSYRGDYHDLAFEPKASVTVGKMLEAARSAVGQTYEGWKGGEFFMDRYTSCWLAEHGHGDGETIGPILLALMLAAPVGDAALETKLPGFLPEWPYDKS